MQSNLTTIEGAAPVTQKSRMQRFLDFKLLKTRHSAITVENVPFLLIHLTPIAAFFLPFDWSLVVLAVAVNFVHMFAITGVFHRYFSHRGFRVRNRLVQFLMGFWGSTCIQQGPIWWASHHRHHHRYSDEPEDLHSPKQQGFWHSHVLWIFGLKFLTEYSEYEKTAAKDLRQFPELVWLDKYYIVAPVTLGVVLFAIGGLPWLVWGLGISTVFLWHGTFTINSLSHVFGKRRFDTTDTSRNNWLLAFVTLGEGWHNNHHAFAGGAKAGFYWYEYDITYYGLWIFHKLGLITELGMPPARIIEQGRENDRLRAAARDYLRPNTVRRLQTGELAALLKVINNGVDQKVLSVLRRLNVQEVRNVLLRLEEAGHDLVRALTPRQPALNS